MTHSIPMQPIVSSQLDSVGHDPVTNTLAVRFKPGMLAQAKGQTGCLYLYENVTFEQFSSLQAAESFNSAFIQAVKKNPDQHPYRKVDESI